MQEDAQQDAVDDVRVTMLEIGTNVMQELVVNRRTLIGVRDERVYIDPRHEGSFTYAVSAGRALISGGTDIEGVSIDIEPGALRIGETVLTGQTVDRLLVTIRDTGNDVTVVDFAVE